MREGSTRGVAPYDPEHEAVASLDLVEWADYEMETTSELDFFLEPEADLDVVPVSVRSSSKWEAVCKVDVTFLGVPRVCLTTDVGVGVPRGMYLGSLSSSSYPMSQRGGATNLDLPL